jgi:hypothetical protein
MDIISELILGIFIGLIINFFALTQEKKATAFLLGALIVVGAVFQSEFLFKISLGWTVLLSIIGLIYHYVKPHDKLGKIKFFMNAIIGFLAVRLFIVAKGIYVNKETVFGSDSLFSTIEQLGIIDIFDMTMFITFFILLAPLNLLKKELERKNDFVKEKMKDA